MQQKAKPPGFTLDKKPLWFNPEGAKITRITPEYDHPADPILWLESDKVNVSIRYDIRDKWIVHYTIHRVNESTIKCDILMSAEGIYTAFGIIDECDDLQRDRGQEIIDRFGGQFCLQGQFIRWKNWLNIPGPGTGLRGDANLSLEITEEIKKVVREFIEYVCKVNAHAGTF